MSDARFYFLAMCACLALSWLAGLHKDEIKQTHRSLWIVWLVTENTCHVGAVVFALFLGQEIL